MVADAIWDKNGSDIVLLDVQETFLLSDVFFIATGSSRTNVQAIQPLYEWARTFERYWQHQLTHVRQRAEARSKGGYGRDPDSTDR